MYSLPWCSGGRSNYLVCSSHFAEAALRSVTCCLLLPLWVSSMLALQAPSRAVLTSHPPVHSEHLLIGFIYSVNESTELPAKGDSKYAHTPTIVLSLYTHPLFSTPPLCAIASSHLADRACDRQLMWWHGGSEGCCPAAQTKPYGTFVMACRGQ